MAGARGTGQAAPASYNAPDQHSRETTPVPKMKTHRGAADRFAVTKRGKLLRGHAKLNHLLSKKSSRQKRRLGRMSIVAEGDRRSVRRMLGR